MIGIGQFRIWFGTTVIWAAVGGVAVAQTSSKGPAFSATGRDQARSATPGDAAGGGAAFADFQSLIDLITTVVEPDAWEALGGSSTLFPYPQGIEVDPAGMVRDVDSLGEPKSAVDDLRERLTSATAPEWETILPAEDDWRRPGTRCVSMVRYVRELGRRLIEGDTSPDAALAFCAGLSRVQSLVFTSDDVLLIGDVDTLSDSGGWWVDDVGRVPMQQDYLTHAATAVLGSGTFGCTIDPTAEGLDRAVALAGEVAAGRVPIVSAGGRMADAIGDQRVSVFGVEPDTSLAHRMVHVDRHMKRLALGILPMPRGVPTYLDAIDAHAGLGPPRDLLLRLWLTGEPLEIARVQTGDDSETGGVWFVRGRGVRLSGADRRPGADATEETVDARTRTFVDAFNDNWSAIASMYPAYGSVASMYRAVGILETVRRHGGRPGRAVLRGLSLIARADAGGLPSPRRVSTIAKTHTSRHGSRRTTTVIASGGVLVRPAALVGRPRTATSAAEYPTRPGNDTGHWWWNL